MHDPHRARNVTSYLTEVHVTFILTGRLGFLVYCLLAHDRINVF